MDEAQNGSPIIYLFMICLQSKIQSALKSEDYILRHQKQPIFVIAVISLPFDLFGSACLFSVLFLSYTLYLSPEKNVLGVYNYSK